MRLDRSSTNLVKTCQKTAENAANQASRKLGAAALVRLLWRAFSLSCSGFAHKRGRTMRIHLQFLFSGPLLRANQFSSMSCRASELLYFRSCFTGRHSRKLALSLADLDELILALDVSSLQAALFVVRRSISPHGSTSSSFGGHTKKHI